ncbi:hypothetical protein niasHS_007173 [Heterodera schachtii]|uniref:nucleoside-diphosphate kinase n=1 Tax=Heterodera schachtii TaxID=97005 RepID=A0ABD2JL72_HETSC
MNVPEFSQTAAGAMTMFYRGRRYYQQRVLRNKTTWRCIFVRTCSGTAVSFTNGRARAVNPHSCQAAIQNIEHSLVIIKPESVRLQFSGRIIAAFEAAGLRKVATKMVRATRRQILAHYPRANDQLVRYMVSGPINCVVFRGVDAIRTIRRMLGANLPSPPAGTIRHDYRNEVVIGRRADTVCHASDSQDEAERETSIWFIDEEIVD